ncbi:uncharacterized protein LOC143257115 isoform X2 [Tachypleus tridentatus]|uniref:uncharacterized protein LOC143257115 isoform X2 n=1 Tax=Tachypleus tridentatus TaxID=6853 RepID=UPI003FD062A9
MKVKMTTTSSTTYDFDKVSTKLKVIKSNLQNKFSSEAVQELVDVVKVCPSSFCVIPPDTLEALIECMVLYLQGTLEDTDNPTLRKWFQLKLRSFITTGGKEWKNRAYLSVIPVYNVMSQFLQELTHGELGNKNNSILAGFGLVGLHDQCLNPDVISSILNILYSSRGDSKCDSDLSPEYIHKYLCSVASNIESGELCLPVSARTQLWLLHTPALERFLLFMISSLASETKSNSSSEIFDLLQQTILPEATSKSPELFQTVISILMAMGKQEEALLPILQDFLVVLVTMVEDRLFPKSLITHFPEEVQFLVLLLLVPPSDIPKRMKLEHVEKLCETGLWSVHNNTCNIEQVHHVFFCFPAWLRILVQEKKSIHISPTKHHFIHILTSVDDSLFHAQNREVYSVTNQTSMCLDQRSLYKLLH